MKWTKRLSKLAVAAKERKRMIPVVIDEPEMRAALHRHSPDFTIQIRSKSGDRVQMSITRFGKQFITSDGLVSARNISRGIETLIREATP